MNFSLFSTPSMSWQCNVKVIAQALTSPVYPVNVILVITLLATLETQMSVWSVLSVLYISNP